MYLKYVICICAMYVCSSLNYVRFCLKLYCEILHHVACYHLLCAGLSVSISQACILSILLSFSTFFFTCKMHAIYVFRSKMYKIMHKIHLFIHNFKVGFLSNVQMYDITQIVLVQNNATNRIKYVFHMSHMCLPAKKLALRQK